MYMEYPWLVSVIPIIFLIIFLIKWNLFTPKTHKNLPPSPPTLPILGNLHQLGLYPHKSLQKLAHQYGPLMQLHFGSRAVLVVSSSEAACEIMKTHDIIFSNRPKLSVADKLLYQGRDVSTAPYGEYWRQMRRICVLKLLSNQKVQSFRTIREEEVALLVDNIKQHCYCSSPMDLSETIALFTNDLISRVALGRKYSTDVEIGNKFKDLLLEFMKLLGGFYVGDFIPWLAWVNRVNGVDAAVKRVAEEFDKFLDRVVEEHINDFNGDGISSTNVEFDEDKTDFVDVLLEIQRDEKAGFPIDRESIKALILDMFAAGTDTTYTVLEWAMAELVRHPRVMNKLQNELMETANGKSHIPESDLDQMHYLKAVTKEILRLYPPIPLLVPRESTQDVIVNGYDIPARTMVITNAWTIGRDPKLWDEPEEFRPERFMNCCIDYKGQDFQLIPFGAGRRGCPGTSFAMTTNQLLLANLVHRFDWSLPDGAKAQDLDMSQCIGLTIHRKAPLLLVPTPRC